MAAKSAQDGAKLHQYQDILLRENQQINQTLIEVRSEMALQLEECRQKDSEIGARDQEIEALKLKLTDMEEYRAAFEKMQARRGVEKEVVELTKRIE